MNDVSIFLAADMPLFAGLGLWWATHALRKWRFRRWARSLHLKPIRIKGGLEIKHLHGETGWGEGVVFIACFEVDRLYICPVMDLTSHVTLQFNQRKKVVPLTDEEIIEEMLFKTPVARALEQIKEPPWNF